MAGGIILYAMYTGFFLCNHIADRFLSQRLYVRDQFACVVRN